MSSPFDEALSRPFLDEPVKKRWSWLSAATERTRSRFPGLGSDRGSDDEALSVSYREYAAPVHGIQEIVFEREENGHDKTLPSKEPGWTIGFGNDDDDAHPRQQQQRLLLEEGRAMDLELAILEERHHDITEIHTSMKQINQIQKGTFAVEVHKRGTVLPQMLTVLPLPRFTICTFQTLRKSFKFKKKIFTSFLSLLSSHWIMHHRVFRNCCACNNTNGRKNRNAASDSWRPRQWHLSLCLAPCFIISFWRRLMMRLPAHPNTRWVLAGTTCMSRSFHGKVFSLPSVLHAVCFF